MIDQETHRKLWDTELEILRAFDKVCIENNLKYSLAFGSMIGVIRHGGFIPWDDDLDVFMPRSDYETLIRIWDKVAPNGYLLQNKRNENTYVQNFTKIRKDNTSFIQIEEEKYVKYHTGVFIDIFPGDRLAEGKIARKWQKAMVALNLLYSREFKSGSGGIQGILERVLLAFPHWIRVKLFCLTEKAIQKWNNSDAPYFFPCTKEWMGKVYPSDMFEGLLRLKFENMQAMCSKDYDEILTNDYGEYMEYPPEEDQVLKHHPIYLSFTQNYEHKEK